MSAQLIDPFGRRIEYLRLSVTDRCNLRCQYCLPEQADDFVPPASWLDFAEIERLASRFVALGIRHIRLTGGEPLTRARLAALAARLARLPGLRDLSLSTNGVTLARQAEALRQAGIHRLNISLDSLRDERIHQITGQPVLKNILAGIHAATTAGFTDIRINMVIIPGTNDDEIDDMVTFCRDRQLVLRLIEPMPVGDSGRSVHRFDLGETRHHLAQKFQLGDAVLPGAGPARYLASDDQRFFVGFITPLSQHFCHSCNRVRLTADGHLQLCLGQDDQIDLRSLLRDGISDAELDRTIRNAIARKPERHEFVEHPARIIRFMSATGG